MASSPVGSESGVVGYVTAANADVLECGVCFLPLNPPIFQCTVGHVVCSLCCDKLKAAGKCHMCRVAMASGYGRCHAMERVVDSVRAPCPHAPYGCDATPAYHAREDHLRECPHGPCHCPAGDACGFVGSAAALLDHAASAHGWPCVSVPQPHSSVVLRVALNFVSADDEHGNKHQLLLNVVRRPFGRAVSVLCIRPRAAAAEEVKATVEYQWSDWTDPLLKHEQRTEFRVPCSDLSDGVPHPNESYQLNVPKCVDGDDTIVVKVSIATSRCNFNVSRGA